MTQRQLARIAHKYLLLFVAAMLCNFLRTSIITLSTQLSHDVSYENGISIYLVSIYTFMRIKKMCVWHISLQNGKRKNE
jgi:hypothetical protein